MVAVVVSGIVTWCLVRWAGVQLEVALPVGLGLVPLLYRGDGER